MSTDNKKQFQYIDVIKTNDEQQFQIPNRLKHNEFSPSLPSSSVVASSLSPSSSKQLIKNEQLQEDNYTDEDAEKGAENQYKDVVDCYENDDGGNDDGGGCTNKKLDNYRNYPSIVVHHYPTTTAKQENQKIQLFAASSSINPSTTNQSTANNRNVYGRLSYNDDNLYISDHSVEIGRNSSTSSVHFHVGRNSFVSRKHLQMIHDPVTNEFYLNCLSKNGIFIDDVFQRKSMDPIKLTSSCNFRFPSTNIRIYFESFVDPQENVSTTNYQQPIAIADIEHQPSTLLPPPQSFQRKHISVTFDKIPSTPKSILINDNSMTTINNVIYAPLKISIPDQMTDKKSPFPSPTGTISAANSCPTSPRQSFQEYHHHYHHQKQQQYHHQTFSNSQNPLNIYQNNDQFLHPPQQQSTISIASTDTTKSTTEAKPSSLFNDFDKPPYSYAQLIVQSISAATDKQLTLSGIYSFISKNYPYYRKEANKGWQNSIRHNLSLNRYFLKVARSQDEPGKGSFWRIDPNSETKLIDQSYKKRRQRGNQCFRTPYGMPRSAPVSPSHNESSRSPVQDIVLQSAPGSPGAPYHSNHDNYYVSQSMVSPSNFQYENHGPQFLTNPTIIKSHLVDIYEDQHHDNVGDRASSGHNNNNNDGRDFGLMSGDDDYDDDEENNDIDGGDDGDIDCDNYDNSHVLPAKRTKFD